MSSFRSAPFRWLWCSTLASAAATGMHTTATAWLALDTSGGAFAVGLVLAARMLPSLLLGLAAGTLADRGHRTRLLVIVGFASLPVMVALNRLASAPSVPVWQLVALVFALGCVTVFDVPSRQALVMDTVPRDLAANAMSLNATATRLFTAFGAFVAGALIPVAGVRGVYVGVAAAYILGALLVAFVHPPRTASAPGGHQHPPFARSFVDAARLLIDNPAVRTLVATGVACEVFGFSFSTAVPVFARDVLGGGAEALGTLNAAASLGGAIALIGLSLVPGHIPREPMLAFVFFVYGASLIALAQCNALAMAATVLLVTGACAAAFDVLQQTLLQLAVPEHQRGRAVGVWVLGIGSAPIGHLEMGTLAATAGAPIALLLNGCLVLIGASTLLVRAPAFRARRRGHKTEAAEAGRLPG